MKIILMMVILSVTIGLAVCSNADDATLDVGGAKGSKSQLHLEFCFRRKKN